jgi:hypothetical protein
METRGRKKIAKEERKTPVTIYLQAQEIQQLGGIENTRNQLIEYAKTKVYVTTDNKRLLKNRH